MLVAFLQDFRGVETREQFFARGEEWDAPDDLALRLIHDGRAVAAAAKVGVRVGQVAAAPAVATPPAKAPRKKPKA